MFGWIALILCLAIWYGIARWIGKYTKVWFIKVVGGLMLLLAAAGIVILLFINHSNPEINNWEIGKHKPPQEDFRTQGELELKRQQHRQLLRNSMVEISLKVSYMETPSGLRIHGTTNLPDGTKLGVTIKQGGQDFDIFVKNGKFSSANFTNRGRPLAGDYQVTVFTYKNRQWQSPAILNQLEFYKGEMISGRKIEKTINISVGSVQARKSNLNQQSQNKQRFNQLAQMAVGLLSQGKQMDRLRNGNSLKECGTRMRELQPRAKSLQAEVTKLPGSYKKMLLGAASTVLTLCVSCSESLAMQNCNEAENYLHDAGVL